MVQQARYASKGWRAYLDCCARERTQGYDNDCELATPLSLRALVAGVFANGVLTVVGESLESDVFSFLTGGFLIRLAFFFGAPHSLSLS